MFGDVAAFEARMLEPSGEVLERAKSIGQQIAWVSAGQSGGAGGLGGRLRGGARAGGVQQVLKGRHVPLGKG